MATTIEYSLIGALIGVVVIAAVGTMNSDPRQEGSVEEPASTDRVGTVTVGEDEHYAISSGKRVRIVCRNPSMTVDLPSGENVVEVNCDGHSVGPTTVRGRIP